MITEDYVSFETAKLLKEKGFSEECLGTYSTDDKELSISSECPYSNDLNDDMFIAAPTIQMAMKWLREVHKYLIVVGNKNGNYLYLIKDLKANTDLGFSNDEYIHYEEACEAAIKYCLENLI